MQIGQAAKASGVTTKMIRRYEAIGLVPSAERQPSNYRDTMRPMCIASVSSAGRGTWASDG